jgi:hypothetical protein
LSVTLSHSVDEREYGLMMRGFGSALLSEEAKAYFDGGAGYALSTVFFASMAMHGDTRIISTSQQVKQFVQTEFFNSETNIIRTRPSNLDRYTSISTAMTTTIDLFSSEERQGFEAMHRAVVLAGDGVNNYQVVNGANVADLVVQIATRFNGVVHGIPILDPNQAATTSFHATNEYLVNYFKETIATPQGLRCECNGLNVPVRAGEVFPAHGFEQVAPAVLAALRGIQL